MLMVYVDIVELRDLWFINWRELKGTASRDFQPFVWSKTLPGSHLNRQNGLLKCLKAQK